MKSPTLTIDLGSSNTKIYQLGAGIVLAEPSVIAINETARGKIKAIGADAKSLIGKTVDGTVVPYYCYIAGTKGAYEDMPIEFSL